MLVNDTDKKAAKQALASLVARHGYEPGTAAVGVAEAALHFGLQLGNMSQVSSLEGYAERIVDGPNALWETLPLSGQIVKRVKHVLPA